MGCSKTKKKPKHLASRMTHCQGKASTALLPGRPLFRMHPTRNAAFCPGLVWKSMPQWSLPNPIQLHAIALFNLNRQGQHSSFPDRHAILPFFVPRWVICIKGEAWSTALWQQAWGLRLEPHELRRSLLSPETEHWQLSIARAVRNLHGSTKSQA